MKSTLGQFYTTNYQLILSNLYVPATTTTVIEPFCGMGDLLPFITDPLVHIECYDIEPKSKDTIQRDTLLNPPDYTGKFILTNPPYLARNKCKSKILFDLYNVNDLYKCFLKNLLTNIADGGIIIIPVNFWSSIRKSDIQLRKDFLACYSIVHVNIFEYPVFDDTDYAVCSFQFERVQHTTCDASLVDFTIHSSAISSTLLKIDLTNDMCLPGGEIYTLPIDNTLTITRLTSMTTCMPTRIHVDCIDGIDKRIQMRIVSQDKIYCDDTPKLSARSFATLIIVPTLSLDQQQQLVDEFNHFLDEQRGKTNSLFLTNYREGKRKRISFALVYRIVNYLLVHSNIL